VVHPAWYYWWAKSAFDFFWVSKSPVFSEYVYLELMDCLNRTVKFTSLVELALPCWQTPCPDSQRDEALQRLLCVLEVEHCPVREGVLSVFFPICFASAY
jgi:hypothetical protein